MEVWEVIKNGEDDGQLLSSKLAVNRWLDQEYPNKNLSFWKFPDEGESTTVWDGPHHVVAIIRSRFIYAARDVKEFQDTSQNKEPDNDNE